MDLERKSSVHVVKGPDAQANAQAREFHERTFAERRWWAKEVRAKTPEELRIIRQVVSGLNDFLKQYGAAPLSIKAQHIHILDAEKLGKEAVEELDRTRAFVAGGYVQYAQHVVIPGWRIHSSLDFLEVLSHEIIHFLSFNAAHACAGEQLPRTYRVGLAAHKQRPEGSSARTNNTNYFVGLNEAITEELNIRFLRTLKKAAGIHLSVSPISKEKPELALWGTRKLNVPPGEPPYETEVNTFAYSEARGRLMELIDEIFAHYAGRFSSTEEIFTIFAKAAVSGDVKEMAQLIEGLGHGRLRDAARQSAD